MQSTDSIETYTYGTSKDLVNEKKEIKYNNIIKLHKKRINVGDVTKENKSNMNQTSHKFQINHAQN